MKKKSITAVVLAGGDSKRMGRNKALLKLGHKTMIEVIVDILKPLFDEVIVVTNSEKEYLMLKNVRFTPDCIDMKDRNALVGLYSGLLAAKNDYIFVVPCDMPLLQPPLIEYMLQNHEEEDVLIPYIKGYYEPLHAIYGKECLRHMASLLQKEDYKITNFFKDVTVRTLEEEIVQKFDPDFKSFFNINTNQEYRDLF